MLLLSLALLGAWLTGRVLTDRFHWSQYLHWMPGVVVTPACVVLALLGGMGARRGSSRVLHRSDRDNDRPIRQRPALRRRVARTLLFASLGAMAYVLAVELRIDRVVLARQGERGDLRVLVWNLAYKKEAPIASVIERERPDVVLLANPVWKYDYTALPGLMGTADAGAELLVAGEFCIASVRPVLAYGTTSLGLLGRRWTGDPMDYIEAENPAEPLDRGRAMFVVLGGPGEASNIEKVDAPSATGLPRGLVVWIIDMPSDPMLGRMDSAREAARMIASFDGPVYLREARAEGATRWIAREGDALGVHGFPEPSLVVGDFNVPRGADSLDVLTHGLASAFARGGRGYVATWPAEFPLLHLDQAFAGRGLETLAYRTVFAEVVPHRAQVIDLRIVPRE